MKTTLIKTLTFVVIAGIVFCSCESRTDVYVKDMPQSGMKVRICDSSAEAVKDCDAAIPQGRQLQFEIIFDTDSLAGYRSMEYYAVMLQGEDNPFVIDESGLPENRITVSNRIEAGDGTIGNVLMIKFVSTDYYGRQTEATLTLTSLAPLAADFQVSVEKNSAMDYSVKVEQVDNAVSGISGRITAYEYAFDSELCHDGAGMEGEFEDEANPNPGHAARFGRYITSTTLPEVSHRFQTSGVHEVSVRVKNDLGLWSSWKTVTVLVE